MLTALMMHMEWADALVWTTVRKLGGSDARLHRLLYHLHATQRAFLQMWQAVPVDDPPEQDFPDFAAIRMWARSYYEPARHHVASADAAQLRGIVNMPWADHYTKPFGRKAEQTTLEETIIQITTHSAYHRGQINARLRELGAEPPLTDFIAWVWVGRPAADWS